MAHQPYAGSALVKFLTKHINMSVGGKTQAEIATQSGFRSPNMLAMVKAGASKLPLEHVPGLAETLGVDPAHLLRLALDQRDDDPGLCVIAQIRGEVLSDNEKAWLQALRNASENTDPELKPNRRKALEAIFATR